MQHVAYVLVLVAKLLVVEVSLVDVFANGGFLAVAILTEHVDGDEVRKAIVIHICHIGAHGKLALVPQQILGLIREGAVLIVDVKNVVGDVIVAHVDIWPAVVVDISNGQT